MIEQFYQDILPEGNVLVATLKGKSFKIFALRGRDDVIPFLSKFKTRSSYQALGGYDDISLGEYVNEYDSKGKKTAGALDDLPSASRIKAWGFDLDVGPQKHKYNTLKEATDTLAALISSGAVPEPRWVVRTGGGLQFYLVLGGPGLPEEVWTAIFSRLKVKLNDLFDGMIDSNVGSTAHSWLRSPCTPNVKYDHNPMPRIVHKGPLLKVAALKAYVDEVVQPEKVKKHESSTVQVSNRISSHSLYAACAAMRDQMETKGVHTLEPQWAAVANISAHTLDPYGVFHACSEGHEDYDEVTAQDKYDHIAASASAGPWGCQNFGNPRDPDSPCFNCWASFEGLKNPVSAARLWEVNDGPPEPEEVPEPADNGDPTSLEDWEYTPAQLSIGLSNYWVDSGELWYGTPDSNASGKHVGTFLLVEPAQFNSDEKRGTCFIGRPGQRKYPIETSKLGTAQSCASALTQLTFRVKDASLMANYIQGMALDGKAVKECVSFGWQDDYTGFYGVNGAVTGEKMHPSEEVEQVGKNWRGQKGNVSDWLEAVSLYDTDSQRPYLFSLLASMAAPLLSYFNLQKGVILTITGDPGTGKSSSTRAANSVWGKPLEQIVTFQSTYVSIRKAIGVCNHLPITIDEHTNVDSEILKALALEISQGEGRSTLTQSRKMRQAEQWQTILITTGNSSYHEKLAEVPNTSGADLTRVMEVTVEATPDVTMAMGNSMVKKLDKNYGLFGPELIAHVCTKDRAAEIKWLYKVIDQMAAIDGLTGQDRFMRDLVAACYMAHRYAKQVDDSFPGDPHEMFEWMRGQLAWNRQRVSEVLMSRIPSADDFMVEFESEGNILVDKGDGIHNKVNSIKGYCYQKGHILYAPKTIVEHWCTRKGVPYRTLIENWRRADRILNLGNVDAPRYSARCPEVITINGKDTRPHVIAVLRDEAESNNSERPANVRDIKRARARKSRKASAFDTEEISKWDGSEA